MPSERLTRERFSSSLQNSLAPYAVFRRTEGESRIGGSHILCSVRKFHKLEELDMALTFDGELRKWLNEYVPYPWPLSLCGNPSFEIHSDFILVERSPCNDQKLR